MIANKKISYEGKEITVRELTVGEIRAWLAEAEAADAKDVDVVGALLFDDLDLADLARMTDISLQDMDALPLSVINQIKGAAKTLNPNFFALRGKIMVAGQRLQQALGPAQTT